MTRTEQWDSEGDAGRLCARLLGGTWEKVDGIYAPNGTYDLRVTVARGSTIAVEVTQDTTETIRRQHGSEQKHDWESDLLSGWWEVSLREPANIGVLHTRIFDLIAQLESDGVKSLSLGRKTPSDPIVDALRSLGVTLLYRLHEDSPGYVNLSPAPDAGSTAPSVLNEIVSDHANRADNAAKLKVDTTDERHLWIWVTTDRASQTAALLMGDAPLAAPSVPSHIDSVWLATALDNPTVWRWSRTGGWARYDARKELD